MGGDPKRTLSSLRRMFLVSVFTRWQHSLISPSSQKEPLGGRPTDYIHYRRPPPAKASSTRLHRGSYASLLQSRVTGALIWTLHNYRQTCVHDHAFPCACLFCFMFPCIAQAGGRTGREPPPWLSPKKQVFFFPPFWFISPRLPPPHNISFRIRRLCCGVHIHGPLWSPNKHPDADRQ